MDYDYRALVQMLFGLAPQGGVSSHAKRPGLVTPEMREQAEALEAWRKLGKPSQHYQYFPSASPKGT